MILKLENMGASCCKSWQIMNKIAPPKACIFITLKDLSAVCCASPSEYNKNFSDFSMVLKLERYYKKNK